MLSESKHTQPVVPPGSPFDRLGPNGMYETASTQMNRFYASPHTPSSTPGSV
jgi:hypothetical protein